MGIGLWSTLWDDRSLRAYAVENTYIEADTPSGSASLHSEDRRFFLRRQKAWSPLDPAVRGLIKRLGSQAGGAPCSGCRAGTARPGGKAPHGEGLYLLRCAKRPVRS